MERKIEVNYLRKTKQKTIKKQKKKQNKTKQNKSKTNKQIKPEPISIFFRKKNESNTTSIFIDVSKRKFSYNIQLLVLLGFFV